MNELLFQQCKDTVDMFSLATNLEAKFIDFDGNTRHCHYCQGDNRSMCNHISSTECREAHLFGAHQSLLFEDSYIFFCPLGLVHFISPIVINSKFVGALISGHILMTEPDIYLINHILKYINNDRVIKDFVQSVQVLSPARVSALAKMLKSLAYGLSDGSKVTGMDINKYDLSRAKHNHSIHKVMNIIKENYMNKITLEEVAKEVSFTSQYLSKIFKEETGHTFKQYLAHVRIEKSKLLLQQDDLTQADVAYLSGYGDQSHFSRTFKKLTGLSPRSYQRSYNNQLLND